MATREQQQQAEKPDISGKPLMVAVGVLLLAIGFVTRWEVSAFGVALIFMSAAAWMWEDARPTERRRAEVVYEAGHRSTVPQRETPKLGVWWLLAGEVILFSALILGDVVFRIGYGSLYGAFRAKLSVPLVAINTMILLTSSYMVVRALTAARRGNSASLVRHLLATIVLGSLFLAGQGYEWAALFRAGVQPGSAFGGSFFTLTGVHGTHVFIGVAWATMATIRALFGAYRGESSLGIEMFGLYWHFVDIVWIILFSIIYLI